MRPARIGPDDGPGDPDEHEAADEPLRRIGPERPPPTRRSPHSRPGARPDGGSAGPSDVRPLEEGDRPDDRRRGPRCRACRPGRRRRGSAPAPRSSRPAGGPFVPSRPGRGRRRRKRAHAVAPARPAALIRGRGSPRRPWMGISPAAGCRRRSARRPSGSFRRAAAARTGPMPRARRRTPRRRRRLSRTIRPGFDRMPR